MKKIRNILMTTAFVFLSGLASTYVLGEHVMRNSMAFAVGMVIAAFAVIIEEVRNIDPVRNIDLETECE